MDVWVKKYEAATFLGCVPDVLSRWKNPSHPNYKGWIEGVHWRSGVSSTSATEYNLTALNHWRETGGDHRHDAWVLSYQSSKSNGLESPKLSA